MTFAIKQLDHVVVRVADMDRAIDFYTKVLGCTVERQVDSIRLVQLRAGLSMIDLVAAKEELRDGPGNMDHFAVRIDPFDVIWKATALTPARSPRVTARRARVRPCTSSTRTATPSS